MQNTAYLSVFTDSLLKVWNKCLKFCHWPKNILKSCIYVQYCVADYSDIIKCIFLNIFVTKITNLFRRLIIFYFLLTQCPMTRYKENGGNRESHIWLWRYSWPMGDWPYLFRRSTRYWIIDILDKTFCFILSDLQGLKQTR